MNFSKKYNNNIVHVILDLPGMFNNRDYVVKFKSIKNNNAIVYEFESIHDLIEPNNNSVRLVNAGGKWKLESINNNLTKVTYIWNGDMSGNFPSWGLKRAWTKQGNEVLGNLKTALALENEEAPSPEESETLEDMGGGGEGFC